MNVNEGNSVDAVGRNIRIEVYPILIPKVHPSKLIDFDVEIYNHSKNGLVWDKEFPVNLSYRWYMSDGSIVIPDGDRIKIGSFILPQERRKFRITVQIPEMVGDFVLRFSCVQEGQFWFCEQFQGGGFDVAVSIAEPAVWPIELNEMIAARALRGGVVARDLAAKLAVAPIICAPEGEVAEAAEVAEARSIEPMPDLALMAPRPIEHLEPLSLDVDKGRVAAAVRSIEHQFAPKASGFGWRQWLSHPLKTFVRTLNTMLSQSSIGITIDGIARSSKELAENLIATQVMLQKMEHENQLRARHYADVGSAQAEQFHQSIKAIFTIAQSLQGAVSDLTRETRLNSQVSLENTKILEKIESDQLRVEKVSRGIAELCRSMQLSLLEFSQMPSDMAALKNQNSALNDTMFRIDQSHGYLFNKIDNLLWRQVFSLPANELVACRNAAGLILIPQNDLDAISYYSSGSFPEPGTLSIVQKLLKPGGRFIDVGANVGMFSLVASRAVGSTGRVWAIEPTPSTLSALKTTLRLNGVSEFVTVLECAAGNEKGTVQINVGQTSGHNSLLPLQDSQNSIDVPMVVLDDVIGNEKVDLIKIDVEGWETEVLKGLRRTIEANLGVTIILEYAPSHLQRAGRDIADWLSDLQAFDLDIFEIDESTATVSPLRLSNLDKVESLNLLMSKHLQPGLRL